MDTLLRLDDHARWASWGIVMDLGDWLRSLGLEQYEAIFRENAIDAAVLPDLTDQDLEKLGVAGRLARSSPQAFARDWQPSSDRKGRRHGRRSDYAP
jgi:SAM domain (Sterile alpha motif)